MSLTSSQLTQLDGVEVRPIRDDLAFGAAVFGLQLDHLKDTSIRSAVYDLLVDKGVILFRDGDGSHEMQLEVSKCIGKCEPFPYPETWVEGHSELVKIKYYPDNGTCYEVNGKRVGGWVPWHTDLIYTARINRGGILRPGQLSGTGGETGFLDQILAYQNLPDELKAKIEDLNVVYTADINLANSAFAGVDNVKFIRGAKSFNEIIKRHWQYPPVVHPMVFTQMETGRKVLNVSPGFSRGIYEIGGPEGDALLREVISYCTREDNVYYHDWKYGDMVLWDNWRTLHSATGVPENETRVMFRTTIEGDYLLGRELQYNSANLEKVVV